MTDEALRTHLSSGATHICYCWSIERRDGLVLGFTDHDQTIEFDGISFQPEAGLSATAIAATTGLSVNNTDALGVLTADAITETDIDSGRYDGARVAVWLVQWDFPDARKISFAGTIGEVTRTAGQFQAELRGLTDALNQPQGRSYLKTCGVILGDSRCGVDITDARFSTETVVEATNKNQVFRLSGLGGYNSRWFENGSVKFVSGCARGLTAVVKSDHIENDLRVVTLWQPIGAKVAPGDRIRLTAGCDKRALTCREKFSNFINFQGFPDIPGEDWLVSVPRSDAPNAGGSRTR